MQLRCHRPAAVQSAAAPTPECNVYHNAARASGLGSRVELFMRLAQVLAVLCWCAAADVVRIPTLSGHLKFSVFGVSGVATCWAGVGGAESVQVRQ